MKRISTFLIAFSCSAVAFAQPALQENFSGTFPPTGWTVIDNDANVPVTGSPYTGTWEALAVFAQGNNSAFTQSIYNPSADADDWLISEQVTIPTSTAGTSAGLIYRVASLSNSAYTAIADYDLMLSTGGNDIADFTVDLNATTIASNGIIYTETVDLSAYEGQAVYIAWVNKSRDNLGIAVDDVTIDLVDNDAISIFDLDLPNYAKNGESVTISGRVVNRGLSPLTSFQVSWDDNTGSNLATISGVNIAPFSIGEFTHTIPLIASGPGTSTSVSVTVDQPNGSADGDLSDNTLTADVFVNNGNTVTRNVLLEEFATASCSICTDAAWRVEEILDLDPNAILVTHHAGFNTDAMTIPEHSTYARSYTGNNTGSTFAPAMALDRRGDLGSTVAIGRGGWAAAAAAQKDVDAYASLTLRGSYANSILSLTATAFFEDYVIPGDIRMTVFLVEDSVSNNPRVNTYDFEWDQVNAYYNATGHPLANVGQLNPATNQYFIENWIYRDVVRDVWPSTDAFGKAILNGAAPQPNDEHEETMNLFVDGGWDLDQMYVVATLNVNNSEITEHGVLNSAKVKLLDLFGVGIDENASSVFNLDIYPNPSSNITNLKLGLVKADDVEMRLFDITGKQLRYEDFGTMTAGTRNIPLNVSELPNGFYFVNLTVGDEVITRKISVSK